MKRRHAGFTLAETLITVALLGIIFTAISGGLVAFEKAYSKVTRKANAQVMLSTSIMEITNDLKGLEIYYSSADAFYTSARGYAIQYVQDTSTASQGLMVKPYSADSSYISVPLITYKANTNDMVVDVSTITYDSATNTFSVTVSIRPNDKVGETIESQTISVRPTKTNFELK